MEAHSKTLVEGVHIEQNHFSQPLKAEFRKVFSRVYI